MNSEEILKDLEKVTVGHDEGLFRFPPRFGLKQVAYGDVIYIERKPEVEEEKEKVRICTVAEELEKVLVEFPHTSKSYMQRADEILYKFGCNCDVEIQILKDRCIELEKENEYFKCLDDEYNGALSKIKNLERKLELYRSKEEYFKGKEVESRCDLCVYGEACPANEENGFDRDLTACHFDNFQANNDNNYWCSHFEAKS